MRARHAHNLLVGARRVGDAAHCDFVAKVNVLGDAEAVNDTQLWIHLGNAEIESGDRISFGDHFAIPADCSLDGSVHAGNALRESGLACTVLAKNEMGFAGGNGDDYALEGFAPKRFVAPRAPSSADLRSTLIMVATYQTVDVHRTPRILNGSAKNSNVIVIEKSA
jgi:hypothetical protein